MSNFGIIVQYTVKLFLFCHFFPFCWHVHVYKIIIFWYMPFNHKQHILSDIGVKSVTADLIFSPTTNLVPSLLLHLLLFKIVYPSKSKICLFSFLICQYVDFKVLYYPNQSTHCTRLIHASHILNKYLFIATFVSIYPIPIPFILFCWHYF